MANRNTKRLRPDQVSRYAKRHNGAQFDNGYSSVQLSSEDIKGLNAKERAKYFNIAREKGFNQ